MLGHYPDHHLFGNNGKKLGIRTGHTIERIYIGLTDRYLNYNCSMFLSCLSEVITSSSPETLICLSVYNDLFN